MSARTMRGDAALSLGLAIPEIGNDLYSRIAKEFADRCRDIGVRMMLVFAHVCAESPSTRYEDVVTRQWSYAIH